MKLTIGFEAETQHLSVVKITDAHQIEKSEYFWTDRLTDTVSIYPDSLTPTYYIAKKKIYPFLNAVQPLDFQYLSINGLKIKKDDINELFQNTEFTITYDTEMEVGNDLFYFILENLKKSIIDILQALASFDTIQKITALERDGGDLFPRRIKFPYPYLAASQKHPHLILFYEDDPQKLFDARFVFQCTLGVPIEHVIQVMQSLHELAHGKKKDKHMDRAETVVEYIMRVGDFAEERKPFLKNLLFIFVYSYLTRHVRKTQAAFVIRHSFAYQMKPFLTPREIDTIASLIEDPSIEDYFVYLFLANVDPNADTNTYKGKDFWRNIQGMLDVGMPSQFNGRIVLIEFRLLNAVLLRFVNEDHISLNTLLKKIKSLKINKKNDAKSR